MEALRAAAPRLCSELDLWLTFEAPGSGGPLLLPAEPYSRDIEVLETKFAPAERAPEMQVRDLHQLLSSIPQLEKILCSVPDVLLFLNEYRQIVFANDATFCFLGMEPTPDVLGNRPGEALGCTHASETAGGCGTTEFCQTCGAVQAILAAQRGNPDVKECRIAIKDSWDALDLKVSTVPFEYEGEKFTICAVQDISDEKRRRALERTFFHDVLNTAGGLRGYAELLLESDPEEVPEVATAVGKISRQLIEEIETQRSLLAAECEELSVNLEELTDEGNPRRAGGGLPTSRSGKGQEHHRCCRIRGRGLPVGLHAAPAGAGQHAEERPGSDIGGRECDPGRAA